jgi:hypothetical protein
MAVGTSTDGRTAAAAAESHKPHQGISLISLIRGSVTAALKTDPGTASGKHYWNTAAASKGAGDVNAAAPGSAAAAAIAASSAAAAAVAVTGRGTWRFTSS